MEIKPNTLLPQDSGMYDQDLSSKLVSLVIPERIFLKSSSDFDDKHINNRGDKWVFYYSGSKRYVYFKLDELTNILLKYFCFKYASTMFPTFLPVLSHQWIQAFNYCKGNGGFTLLILRQYIASDVLDVRSFYSILFGLKILCSEEFPGFTLEDYEDLEFIPRPNAYNWEIYRDIDNLLDPVEKSMISKGLFEMATELARGKCFAIRELKHAVVLGLSYVTGARPVQLAKLAVKDLRIDTCNTDTGLIRYSILLPYVKQRRLTTERLLLAIPPEIGALIKHYVDRVQLLPDDKLLEMGVSAPAFVSQAISQTILNFSPSDYQTAVACGEAALPSITPTDLRHNVGHSLAMQGASAEEIAHDGEEALITIRGFLNIVSLIQRVENGTEKIALNCLLLLIITGFRSVEAFNLRQDALVKRKIDNSDISRRLRDKGLPDYFLGIRYVGVKGAGERTHWVEPLAVPLVENIFKSVKSLTFELRKHLKKLRSKGFADYLPEAVSDIAGESVELDDIVEHIAQSSSDLRGRSGLRDKASKALANRGCIPTKVILGPGNRKEKYYLKSDLSHYLKNEFGDSSANIPCTHAWVENGRRYEIKYEDLLFLFPKGSLTLKRTLELKATPLPLNNNGLNKFLGNYEGYVSIFSKYNLLEEDGRPTQLRTHIPRHNINTFLAIAEISDHLQAMLMGRVDITQNQHYQHLALKERRKVASLAPLVPTVPVQTASTAIDADTPLNTVKQSGMMVFSRTQNLETNIKANLHTFDNRDDVAGFIEASFGDGLFDDIAAAFEEISKNEGPLQASEMVQRHAVLHPLKLGSCMRDVNLWGCPYRMKCQSLKPCEHFTLTGRIDEYSAVEVKSLALNEAKLALEKYTAALPDNQLVQGNIDANLAQLDALSEQLRRRSNSLQVISSQMVLSGEIKVEGEIRTLAQLFALEYQKIQTEEN